MTIRHKSYGLANFKAQGDEGRFTALVSVFNVVDLQGDRVIPGAFEKSIAKWRANGDPVPVIHSHDWGDPFAHIGSVDPEEMYETEDGLRVAGTIDLDNPTGAQVYRLLKQRRLREWSFGYEIIRERPGKDGATELVELDIIEVGPTLKGANPETALLAVKSYDPADIKAAIDAACAPIKPGGPDLSDPKVVREEIDRAMRQAGL